MALVPETYFSHPIRAAQDALPDGNPWSLLAHAQLNEAYRILAGLSDALVNAPRSEWCSTEGGAA